MRFYTNHEDATIKRKSGNTPMAVIATQLGRTENSVRHRARRLGCTPGCRRGADHHNSKLQPIQASMLQALADAGFSGVDVHHFVAASWGVSQETTHDIMAGRTWV